MRTTILSFSLLVAVAFAPGVQASAADAPVLGTVIVARTSGDALLIWDASPEIASIVKDKVSDKDANVRIEHDALRALAGSLEKVGKQAKTITINVVYSRNGDVSPAYGTPTFLGVEKYAAVSAKRDDLAADRDKWKELGDAADVPAWIKFEILGKLPPR